MALSLDASKIARRQNAGGDVASLLDRRAPAPLRNHARDNVSAMRKKAAQLRGKSVLEQLKPPQPSFKLKQFENVQSRVHDLPRPLQRSQSHGPRSPAAAMDLQSHDNEDNQDENAIDLATFEAECERLKQEHGTKDRSRQFQKDCDGRPAYLQKIKANLAEEQRRVEAAHMAPRIPLGHRQVSDNERKETLEALQKKRDELEKAFQNLPLKIETDGQKRRQNLILDKIKETDAAIATFSQQMVLVQE